MSNRCALCFSGLDLVTVEGREEVCFCKKCLSRAKEEFIFYCMSCETVHTRRKVHMINRMPDGALKNAYRERMEEMIVQGIDKCISCDPDAIVEQMGGEFD